jgi:hypothetical protein
VRQRLGTTKPVESGEGSQPNENSKAVALRRKEQFMAFTLNPVDMMYEVVINGCYDCILRSTGVIDRCVPLQYDFKDVTQYKSNRITNCPLPLVGAVRVKAHAYSTKE